MPGGQRGQAGADQPPAVAGPPGRSRVEQLDRQLAPVDQPAADDDEPDVVAVHLDVVAVGERPTDARVVVEVVAAGQHGAGLGPPGEHGVEGADLAARPGDELLHVGVRRPAEAVGAGGVSAARSTSAST